MRIRSLYLKVVVPSVALVLISMVIVSMFAMRAMREGVSLVAEQRAQFIVAYTRNSLEDIEHAMMADHGVRLQSHLDRLGNNPDLDAVRILSSAGKVLYSSRPSEVGQLLPAHAIPPTGLERRALETPATLVLPGVIHASAAIRNSSRCRRCHNTGERILGFVDVDVNLTRQAAGMRTWGQMAAWSSVLQFAAIGAGLVLVLVIVVVRPVRRLVQSMGLVQHGNLTTRAAVTGTRELDVLVDGFNGMVARLQASIQAEDEARRAQLGRVEQLATVGEMAAGLAHEIRNPISGVKAAVEVLAGEHPDPESRQILRDAGVELGRIDGVIRQLLNYARPKAPVLVPVTLNDLVTDALALSQPPATAKGLSLQAILHHDPLSVRADPEMVRQVIVNLVINALHAVEGIPGGRVDVATIVEEGKAVCRVSDNGPGVAADLAESIFRPFFTTKVRGTGLGLATSQRLIEMQGGRLWLENPGAPGASFAFCLPLDQPSH
jgi:two-component system NtrC family sensor kinase